MKISKLFHWLYGLVMLLPFFALGVTCGYAMFNKNAYQSYYGTTLNEETYINNNLSSIDNNQIYYLNTQNYENNTINAFELYTNDFEVVNNGNLATTQVERFNTYSEVRIYCRNNNTPEFYGINNDNSYTWITNNSLFVCKFKINNKSGTINSPLGFYTIEYENMSYISEVFYYSVDKVQTMPIFSWAYDSFLSQPIVYIVNLFSMPTNHVVVELLSYWLAISIIWLVFDLVMYVPLLVHRWIDKGVLE